MGCGASSQPPEDDTKKDATAEPKPEDKAPTATGGSKASSCTSLIVTGAPASGKGKLIKELVNTLKLKQINTVSSVRRRQEEQRKEDADAEATGRERKVLPGSELADKAEAHTKNREEIPGEIMVELLALRVAEADASEGWVLDGYPREEAHSKCLVEKGVVPTKVVVVKVSEKFLIDRQCYRRIDPQDQKIYDSRAEDIPDEVRPRLVTREQDKEAEVKKKIDTYNSQTAGMLAAFPKDLIVEVSGEDEQGNERSSADMVADIKKALGM
jgi:adenylate kinase